jgi:hypothetical protein
MKGKYLITTDAWFYAPNGKQYKSVWGEIEILEDSVLGVKTNRNASNWYAKIGSKENHVIVAGCQIHYAVRSENKPNIEEVEDYNFDAQSFNKFIRPTNIYIAE